MDKMRIIDKLMVVFDLPKYHAVCFPEHASTRVMLVYDREKEERHFKVLTKDMPKRMSGEIEAWLQDNMGIDEIHFELNADNGDIRV
ncbi:MAG: hypothetical protein JRF65_03065 [Deltaproteobacteria bacterium]|nr:hypothetical protein [Deltaproteobacteria bacterium]MBW2283564.1 hypothetical protein [Deltaproteobacteria bacterium]